MVTCDECGQPVDRDEAHSFHEDDCRGLPCRCDLYAHPACCRACDADVMGELRAGLAVTLLLVAAALSWSATLAVVMVR